MFTQLIDPTGSLTLTCLVALIPVVTLLVLLAVFRWPAWVAVLLGSVITFVLAVWVWKMPVNDGVRAYLYGAATGVWNVNWITFWGMVLFNTLGSQRHIREFPPLADRAGQHGRARADHAVRVGLRRTARRPGRIRLSMGGGGADSDFAGHFRPQCDPGRGHRQQCAGFLRRPRRPHHRAWRP